MKTALPVPPKLRLTPEVRARMLEELEPVVQWTRAQGLTEEAIAEIILRARREEREAKDRSR